MPKDEPRDLNTAAKSDQAEKTLLIKTYKESTGLTWLWSLLFGPIYFWVHGFIIMGFVQLIIAIATFGIGILAAPFLAYYAWHRRAEGKADNMIAISNLKK